MTPEAEKFNGWMAMIGIVVLTTIHMQEDCHQELKDKVF